MSSKVQTSSTQPHVSNYLVPTFDSPCAVEVVAIAVVSLSSSFGRPPPLAASRLEVRGECAPRPGARSDVGLLRQATTSCAARDTISSFTPAGSPPP
jgi:hypothetical protein